MAQLYPAMYSQLRHVSTIGKKLLNSNISSTCPHNMVNVCLLTTEIGWRVCGTPANFNVFRVLLRYCTDVAQRTSTKLCTMFGRLLGWYTNGILSGTKFTLCSSLAFFCTRNGITELSLLVIFNRGHHLQAIPKAAIKLDIGPHSSWV